MRKTIACFCLVFITILATCTSSPRRTKQTARDIVDRDGDEAIARTARDIEGRDGDAAVARTVRDIEDRQWFSVVPSPKVSHTVVEPYN